MKANLTNARFVILNKVPLILHSHCNGHGQYTRTQMFLKLSMGQITRWVLQYRSRCRHTRVPCFNIIYDVTEKDPCTRMVITDLYWHSGIGSPIHNFSLSAITKQKQAGAVYNWTSIMRTSIMRTNPWKMSPIYFSVDSNGQQNVCLQGKDFIALSMSRTAQRGGKDPLCQHTTEVVHSSLPGRQINHWFHSIIQIQILGIGVRTLEKMVLCP